MPQKAVRKSKVPSFWQKPAGYFVSAVVLLIAGYILVSFAIDSGSILEWVGGIVAFAWALGRFIQGCVRVLSKTYGKKR